MRAVSSEHRRAGGAAWKLLSGEEDRAASAALGPGEALARLLRAQRVLAWQALMTGVPGVMGVIGTLRGSERAPFLLGSAALVLLALVIALTVTRHLTRERALQLIATGADDVLVECVTRERDRLCSRKERDRLARSFERNLHLARRWEHLPPASRPIPAIRALRVVDKEVEAVVARLREDPIGVQGVALAALFLTCVAPSPLVAGEPALLRQELTRIRYLLDATPGAARSHSCVVALTSA